MAAALQRHVPFGRRNPVARGRRTNPMRLTLLTALLVAGATCRAAAGESAGSLSVSAQMASPLSKDLIAGAIGESGALINPTLPPVPLAEAEQTGVKFATQVGATSLAALRAT